MDTPAVPPPVLVSRRPSRTPLIIGLIVGGFLVLTLVVGLCAGLLLPALASARNSARMMQSQRNLREIGTALMAYSADNRGEAPEAGADLPGRLAPYLGQNSQAWNVHRPDEVPQAYYYVPIGAFTAVKNPSMQMMMYEAPGLWRREGGNVLYADGSVRHTDGLSYRTLIDGATLPDGTAWTPHRK